MSVQATSTGLDVRPQPPLGERAYQHVLNAGLAALGFFVLFSVAGVYLAMAVLLALCVSAPGRIWATRFWREPVLALGLLLLAYIALRTFLGEGWTTASVHRVNKYQELLVVPLLWALLRNARRPQAFVNGLMAGALMLATLYWVRFLLGLDLTSPFAVWLHSRRISAGFGLAVCAFLFFEHARLGHLPARRGLALALYLAATVFFALDGRTGHAVLLLLVCCAAFRAAPPRARIAAALGAVVVVLAAGALSHSVRERVVETLSGVHSTINRQAAPETSTTARFEIWHSAAIVAREHWMLGTGWGHYGEAADEASRRRHADPGQVLGARSDNPHSEFLMQLAAGGVPALLLFTLWVAWPIGGALRRAEPRPWAGALACVALGFAVGAAFNSLLLDFVEAHFYAAVLAWLLVRRVED